MPDGHYPGMLQVAALDGQFGTHTMRGLKRLRSTRVVSAGHAFIQNLRRGHYELGIDVDPRYRLPAVFAELALAI